VLCILYVNIAALA